MCLKSSGVNSGREIRGPTWGRLVLGPGPHKSGAGWGHEKLSGAGRGGANLKIGGAGAGRGNFKRRWGPGGAGPLEICNMDNNIYLNYLIRIIFILVSHFLCAYHLNWFLTFPDIISYKIGNMSFWLCTVQYAY